MRQALRFINSTVLAPRRVQKYRFSKAVLAQEVQPLLPSLQQRLNFCETSATVQNVERNQDDMEVKRKRLLDTFPDCAETIDELVNSSSILLNICPRKLEKYARTIRKHGEERILLNKEILQLFDSNPDILKIHHPDYETRVVETFISCDRVRVPWHVVMLSNPDLFFHRPKIILNVIGRLNKYFKGKEKYNLLENNPYLFRESWEATEEKIEYLVKEMTVSLKRISETPHALTHPLELYQFRYKFLTRAGLYMHPSLNQIGKVVTEAEPALSQICKADDKKFLKKCAPQISLEEFNAFKSLHYLEEAGDFQDDFSPLDEYDELTFDRDDGKRGSETYKGKVRTHEKKNKKSSNEESHS